MKSILLSPLSIGKSTLLYTFFTSMKIHDPSKSKQLAEKWVYYLITPKWRRIIGLPVPAKIGALLEVNLVSASDKALPFLSVMMPLNIFEEQISIWAKASCWMGFLLQRSLLFLFNDLWQAPVSRQRWESACLNVVCGLNSKSIQINIFLAPHDLLAKWIHGTQLCLVAFKDHRAKN